MTRTRMNILWKLRVTRLSTGSSRGKGYEFTRDGITARRMCEQYCGTFYGNNNVSLTEIEYEYDFNSRLSHDILISSHALHST